MTDTYMYDKATLKEKQALPFEDKVQIAYSRIAEFCMLNDNNICVAFSGGADSTVLLDMVCFVWDVFKGNPKPIKVIYSNTSNEFATMPKHARKIVELMKARHNVDIEFKEIRGKKTFVEVIKTEGYAVGSKKIARMVRDCRNVMKNLNLDFNEIEPHLDNDFESVEYLRGLGLPDGVILNLTGYTSKNRKCKSFYLAKKWRKLIIAPFDITEKCCDYLKKEPMKAIQKETKHGIFVGTMASDSEMRETAYKKTGCINFTKRENKCTPMGAWMHQDKMRYLVEYDLPVAPVYGEIKQNENGEYYFTGEQHTGCKLCLFGCHMEKGEDNRIQRLAKIEPATYNFAMKPRSEGGLGFKEVMDYIGLDSDEKD